MSQQEEEPSRYTRTFVVKPALSQMYVQLLPTPKSLEIACKHHCTHRSEPRHVSVPRSRNFSDCSGVLVRRAAATKLGLKWTERGLLRSQGWYWKSLLNLLYVFLALYCCVYSSSKNHRTEHSGRNRRIKHFRNSSVLLCCFPLSENLMECVRWWNWN